MRQGSSCFSVFAVSFAVFSALGCKDATNKSCPAVVGVFSASYQQLQGSCDATFSANTLTMVKTDKDMVTSIENRLADSVTTEVTLNGCTLGLKQSVATNAGHTTSEISGDLEVNTASSLSGMMMRTVYNGDGSVACHGIYVANYTRQDVVLGGAAGHAQTAP